MGTRGRLSTIILGVTVPAALFAALALLPPVRAVIGEFFGPPAPSSVPLKEATKATPLPKAVGLAGAETPELHALAKDEANAAARPRRDAVFPTDPQKMDPFVRPSGSKRSSLASRDDASVDTWVQYILKDERGRNTFIAALKRSGRYRATVEQPLRDVWKIPEELFAIVLEESGAIPTHATDTDGSAGLWGLRPDVAANYKLRSAKGYDERFAVIPSSDAAGHFLADLHERFGSWELAILAYGTGYARTLRLLEAHKTTDFWDVAASLPADDGRYVYQVLALATVLANADKYGFGEVHPDPRQSTSDIELPGGTTFADVACAGFQHTDDIRMLNPEYLEASVPRSPAHLVVHVPSEALTTIQGRIQYIQYHGGCGGKRGTVGDGGALEAAAVDGSSGNAPDDPVTSKQRIWYHAKEGDTVQSVAKHFGITADTLARDNALDPTEALSAGQLLTVRANNTR